MEILIICISCPTILVSLFCSLIFEKRLMNVKSAISRLAISSESSSSSIGYKIPIQLQHRDEPCRTQLQHKISFFAVVTALDPLFTAKMFQHVSPIYQKLIVLFYVSHFLYICLKNVLIVWCCCTREGSQY